MILGEVAKSLLRLLLGTPGFDLRISSGAQLLDGLVQSLAALDGFLQFPERYAEVLRGMYRRQVLLQIRKPVAGNSGPGVVALRGGQNFGLLFGPDGRAGEAHSIRKETLQPGPNPRLSGFRFCGDRLIYFAGAFSPDSGGTPRGQAQTESNRQHPYLQFRLV